MVRNNMFLAYNKTNHLFYGKNIWKIISMVKTFYYFKEQKKKKHDFVNTLLSKKLENFPKACY
jgi:hypothetical protein